MTYDIQDYLYLLKLPQEQLHFVNEFYSRIFLDDVLQHCCLRHFLRIGSGKKIIFVLEMYSLQNELLDATRTTTRTTV